MFKTIIKPLIASSAIVSALVLFNADLDATGRHQNAVFEAAPTTMTARFDALQAAPEDDPESQNTSPPRKTNRLRTRTVTAQQKRYLKKQIELTAGPKQPVAKPLDPEARADFMHGACNSAGGGASTNPDGTVSCVDPDGNDALDPVPAPD